MGNPRKTDVVRRIALVTFSTATATCVPLAVLAERLPDVHIQRIALALGGVLPLVIFVCLARFAYARATARWALAGAAAFAAFVVFLVGGALGWFWDPTASAHHLSVMGGAIARTGEVVWPPLTALAFVSDRWPTTKRRWLPLFVLGVLLSFATNALLLAVRAIRRDDVAIMVSVLLAAVETLVAVLLVADLGRRPDEGVSPADEAVARGIASAEDRWIEERRKFVRRDPTRARVGLALSGGGIRSAVVCVGVLQGLAERGLLGDVDYLSTVSGGGWAGGAMTARVQSEFGDTKIPKIYADASKVEFWNSVARDFRVNRSYLLPDGRGASSGARVALMLATGAIANLLALLLTCFGALTLVGLASRADHPIAPTLRTVLDTCQPRLAAWYPFPIVDTHLYILNAVVPMTAALFAVAGAALAGILVGYMPFVPRRVLDWSTRAFGTFVLLGAVSLLATLILQGSMVVTILLLAIAVGVIASQWVQRSGLRSFGTVVAALTAAQKLVPHVGTALQAVTKLWSSALRSALDVPSLVLTHFERDNQVRLVFVPLLLALFLVMFIDRNRTGLHAFWTERIASAFLHVPTATVDGCERPMSDFRPAAGAPLHIVSCALNVPASQDPELRGRGTDHFEITPCGVGSRSTGWAPASAYGGGLTFADAIGVSAAAVNSQGGLTIPRAVRGLLSTLNLRLGLWLRNPRDVGDRLRFRVSARLWSLYSTMETFGLNSERDSMVLVSDGGHHDNLGLLALVRREIPLIVCVDAGADPDYTFSDLAMTLHILREQGWECDDFDDSKMRPSGAAGSWEARLVESPVQRFTLVRPARADGTAPEKRLCVLLVKSSLTHEIPYDVRAYAQSNLHFPQQTTVDQFFDAAQFDAYLVTGRCLSARLKEPFAQALERVNPPAPKQLPAAAGV